MSLWCITINCFALGISAEEQPFDSLSYLALAWMMFTTFTMNVGAAVMLIPSLLAVILSGFMNISIFWNRMGTREQKKALVAMGWVNENKR